MTENTVEIPKERFATWLMEPMRRNKPTYIKVAVAAAMINLFGLVTSLFTMTVYDRVLPNNATESLIALSIGLAIVVVFDFILKLLRAYFVDIAGASIDPSILDALAKASADEEAEEGETPAETEGESTEEPTSDSLPGEEAPASRRRGRAA